MKVLFEHFFTACFCKTKMLLSVKSDRIYLGTCDVRGLINQIMYLLTIKKISNSKHVIRSVDVASQMEYSRASIHKMLGTLKKLKLIDQEYYGSIKLTSLGSRVANAYQKKYDTIVSALQGTVNLPEGYNLGICYLAELM